ncbi:MAG: ABC transporter ATP-binding protein [Deltaproteobacteria bacterium]|nr:ABC transporter ATP-binding protein [Deltaproteobacteria bacterium]
MNDRPDAEHGSNVPLYCIESICKSYVTDKTETRVLQNVSFSIYAGDIIAIIGPSGAGKSTLLHILGTLDKPTAGRISYRGSDVFGVNAQQLAAFRNRKIGFVFQFHHLLPEFTALENTMMPAMIGGADKAAVDAKARDLLQRIGLGKRLHHQQGELSGGEQQRVAIARALIMEPEIVLADEPTGNLDSHTGQEVFELLLELNREIGMTLMVVTHNETFARKLPRCIALQDGKIVSQ